VTGNADGSTEVLFLNKHEQMLDLVGSSLLSMEAKSQNVSFVGSCHPER
jgi:hypothetical protein